MGSALIRMLVSRPEFPTELKELAEGVSARDSVSARTLFVGQTERLPYKLEIQILSCHRCSMHSVFP